MTTKELPAFQHKPLSQPEKQIRLLRIQAGKQDDSLALELSTWLLREAPEFRAVSYAWGDEQCRSLTINDQTASVRENCYHALWQIRPHWPDETYIWLDAICINQENLQEKSAQVLRMPHIYSRAVCVLACIGPHVDGSEVLLDMVPRIEALGQTKPVRDAIARLDNNSCARGAKFSGNVWEIFQIFLVNSLGSEYINDIRATLSAFLNRPYWTRLWIIQELAAAKGNIQVLCGLDTIPWRHIGLMSELTGGEPAQRKASTLFGNLIPRIFWNGQSAPWPITLGRSLPVAYKRLHRMTLRNAMYRTKRRECADVRDKIYGILSLLDSRWTRPIVPDYRKTPFEVAVDILPHLFGIVDVFDLFARLDLHNEMPEIEDLFDNGRREKGEGEELLQEEQMMEIFADAKQTSCSKITLDEDGELMAVICESSSLLDPKDEDFEEVQRLTGKVFSAWRRAHDRWKSEDRISMPQSIKVNGQIAAFVCGNTEAGDIFAPINDLLLILRPNSLYNDLDVVGQGFLLPGYMTPVNSSQLELGQRDAHFAARALLRISREDVMRLVGRDFIGEGIFGIDARFERLVTKAVERGEGAARLEDVEAWGEGV